MEIKIITEAQTARVAVIGRVDTITAAEFETATQELTTQQGIAITMDCTELSYVSSSGLRVFLKLLKSVTANSGTLTIENLSAEIREVFDITGFSSLFTIL